MCKFVVRQVRSEANPNSSNLAYLRFLFGGPKKLDSKSLEVLTPEALCRRILWTCYMPSSNSSSVTRDAAEAIAKTIGSNHSLIAVKKLYQYYLKVVTE